MIQARYPISMRFVVLFISYIAILQVLYAFQNMLVSIPFVATMTTFYVLIFQRTNPTSKSLKIIPNHSGSKPQSDTTHERDLQHLLVQQTEEVLQTDLKHFRQVKY